MSRKTKKIEADVRQQAGDAGKAARELAEQGKDWATPKMEAAIDWAGPRVDKAWKAGVTATAPKLATAAGKSRDAVDVAHDKLVDDVLPKVIQALEDAAKAAKTSADSVQSQVQSTTKKAEKALKKQEKAAKGGSTWGKTLGWVLVGSAVAGAGVLIWRRTQPVDDPWAEEYWDDAVAPAAQPGVVASAAQGAEQEPTTAADSAKAASEKVEDITQDVKDSVQDKKDD